MIKIFCLTEQLNNGASIPRVNSVKHLEETGFDVMVQVGTELRDFEIWWCDILMLHWAYKPWHLESIKKAKALGKKIWVDVDDDQLAVPLDHPNFGFFASAKETIKECCQLADVVTISNPQILKSFDGLSKNFIYYPCAYDERLMPEPDLSPRNKIIVWRGSPNTQRKSISTFADSIGRIDKEFKDWKFVFIGDAPWELLEQIKNNEWQTHGFLPTQAMWNYTREIKPAIQMVFHVDRQLERSRSNMAVLDATIAGAVVVAPDFKHFRTPGTRLYTDLDHFESLMGLSMSTFNEHRSCVEESWEYIKKHQTFKEINKAQWKLICDLMEKK